MGVRYQAAIASIAFGINNKGKVHKFARERLGERRQQDRFCGGKAQANRAIKCIRTLLGRRGGLGRTALHGFAKHHIKWRLCAL